MGDSDDDLKYFFVIKDHLSGYAWLDAYQEASAENSATTMAPWNLVLTTPRIWISDQGLHFFDNALQFLSTSRHIHHILKVAYSPWANSSVEALMRPVRKGIKDLTGELRLAHRINRQ